MGFFSDLGSTFVRGAADVATFGTNELLGNPAGNLYNSVVNGTDPNAGANAQQYALAQQNIALQREFAQNGIQWRVADAAKAGLSPLAALGATEPNFAPVSAQVFPADTAPRNIGLQALAGMGQDLWRSRLTGASDNDRRIASNNLRLSTAQADLVETQLKLAKLNLAHQAGVPNPAVPDRAVMLDSSGNPIVVPSDDFARSERGDPSMKWDWMLRNRILGPLRDASVNLFGHNVGMNNAADDFAHGVGAQ